MRVLHVITGLSRGGAEGALYRLCSAGDPREAIVVSLMDEGIYGSKLRDAGIEVHAIGMQSSLSLLAGSCRLRDFMKAKRPDIVQTWMYHADLIGGLAAASLGLPICWGIRHTDLSRAGNKTSTLLVARACALLSGRIPQRAISCSKRAAETHKAIGYKVPFEIVPNGFDVARWSNPQVERSEVRTELGVLADDFVFAHAGRSDPQKDHASLAIAFNSVVSRQANARLLLCGDGLAPGNTYFEALPFTSEARQAVIALGVRDDLPHLWQGADAFVLSSLGEAFPNVVAEAMASGMPCIVTDVGDAADIVGETGFIVSPSDPSALARAMLAMKSMDAEDRARLALAARLKIETEFTVDRMVDGFRRTWASVIERRRGSCAD